MRKILVFFIMLSCSFTAFASARVDTIFSDYLTPLMYGAKGDGKHDDTNALRKALYESDQKGKILYFPSGYHFRVTGTLNYYNKEYKSYTLNMLGCIPIKQSSYVPKEYGGIAVEKGVSYWNLYVY